MMTEQEKIREVMKLLGSRKSEAKTRACRENAKLPRKRKPMTELNRKRATEGRIAGNSHQRRKQKRAAKQK
jgi:hypothetical protein